MARISQSFEQQLTIFKSITESIKLPVFSVDTAYRYTSFNRAHSEQMKFLHHAEIELNKCILDYFTQPSDSEKVKYNIDKALQGEHWIDEACSGEPPNRVHYEVIHDPVYDNTGKIIGAAFIGRDITNYRETEEKLNEIIRNYNSIFQTSPNAIVVTDKNGIVKIWNEAAEQIFGWKKEETIGNYAHFIPKDKTEEAKVVRARILSGETIKGFETVRLDITGRRIDVRFSASPFRDGQGAISGIIAIIEDISGRKAIESELLESQLTKVEIRNQLQTVMDHMLEGCQILDNDWRYKYLNDAAVRDARMERSYLIGRKIMDCFPDFEKTYIYGVLKDCMDNKVFRKVYNEFTYEDQSKGYFNLSITPIPEGLFILSLDITEQKLAEENIRLSEERFRHTFESANVGKSITLPNGQIHVNKALSNMLGYSIEELNGMKWQDITPPEEVTRIESILAKLLIEKKDSTRFEKNYIHKSGHIVSADVSVRAIYNPDGSIAYFITTIIDITEKKKAQEALQISELKLKLFVEYAPAGIAMFDNQLRFMAVSQRFLSDYGLTREIIGKHQYEVFPEVSEKWKAIHRRCLAGATESEEKDSFVWSDGSINWVRWKITPWFENEKQIGGIVLFSELITDRIKAEDTIVLREAELRKMNETLEQKIAERTAEVMDLYNNSPCGYHSLNKEGVFELVNDTELRWLGYERHELINNKKAIDILTQKSQETFRQKFPRFMQAGYLTDLELDFIRKDGSILSVLLNATAVYDSAGSFLRSRSTMIDHTARKQAELSLKNALTRLEEANKELESFSYSVSHDLRAPLRAINGFTQILLEDYSPRFDEEGRRICDVIQHNSDMMGRLIDDLLAFSRFGRSEMNMLNIPMHRVIQPVIKDLITPELKSRIEIRMGELPEVKIDPSLMKQVWVNLVSNAVKYSSRKEQTIIDIFHVIQDDRIVFSIKDNGIGFDMLYVDKLFGVFQRLHTENEFEGTGVGLAIVKRIINRHGGEIWAESRSGEGSVFSFSIPK